MVFLLERTDCRQPSNDGRTKLIDGYIALSLDDIRCLDDARYRLKTVGNVLSQRRRSFDAAFLECQSSCPGQQFDAEVAIWLLHAIFLPHFFAYLANHVVKFAKRGNDVAEREPIVIGHALFEHYGK